MARVTEKTVFSTLYYKRGTVSLVGEFRLIRVYRFGKSFIGFQGVTAAGLEVIHPTFMVWKAILA
jgi:hypothetical protein